jgi:hypothetical protein
MPGNCRCRHQNKSSRARFQNRSAGWETACDDFLFGDLAKQINQRLIHLERLRREAQQSAAARRQAGPNFWKIFGNISAARSSQMDKK